MFVPENEMERLLVQASTDPVARPRFYEGLLHSAVIVLPNGPPLSAEGDPVELPVEGGSVMFPTGTKIGFQPVQNGSRSLLPIFSSLPRLQRFSQVEVRWLEMPAREFFTLTQGQEVVLNPGSDYGKEFTVTEIEQMLTGWKPSKTYVTQKEVQVRLGQPARYPSALIEALSRLFSGIREVECAYLAHLDNPDQGDPPHTLIGIKATGDWNKIAAQAGIVLAGIEIPDPPVDFFRMGGTGGPNDYLLTTKPFYTRKLFGLF